MHKPEYEKADHGGHDRVEEANDDTDYHSIDYDGNSSYGIRKSTTEWSGQSRR